MFTYEFELNWTITWNCHWFAIDSCWCLFCNLIQFCLVIVRHVAWSDWSAHGIQLFLNIYMQPSHSKCIFCSILFRCISISLHYAIICFAMFCNIYLPLILFVCSYPSVRVLSTFYLNIFHVVFFTVPCLLLNDLRLRSEHFCGPLWCLWSCSLWHFHRTTWLDDILISCHKCRTDVIHSE